LHGVGVSCVNALSNHMRVEVHREGKIFEQEYSCGKPLYAVREIGSAEDTGTTVTFHPDPTIFTETIYQYDILQSRMRELAYLNKNITITLTDLRETDAEGNPRRESFHSSTGLNEFVTYLDSAREPLIPTVIHMDGERDDIPVEVALHYNTSYTENIHSYVNNINTIEGGT